MATCEDIVKKGGYEILGFSDAEMAKAICVGCHYSKSFDGRHITPDLVKSVLASRWTKFGKSVVGGLQHVISVDNAAGYAELWTDGGSWYAVTGASLSKALDSGTNRSAIWEVPGIKKGMTLDDAAPRFAEAIFGGSVRLSKGCGCGK